MCKINRINLLFYLGQQFPMVVFMFIMTLFFSSISVVRSFCWHDLQTSELASVLLANLNFKNVGIKLLLRQQYKKSKSSVAFLNLKLTFSNFLISFNILHLYLSLMMLGIALLVGKYKRIRKRKTRVATLINIVSD